MSTVKISQLPLSNLSSTSNTSNIFFVIVDSASSITSKVTETQVSQSIFSNNILNVGINPIVLPNVVSQFTGNSSTFIQSNIQNYNINGSADIVGTADVGTDYNNYIDVGINNSTFINTGYTSMNPLDGYLYVQGSGNVSNTGNLVIGTASSGANIVFIAGGTNSNNIIGQFGASGITLSANTTINNKLNIAGDVVISGNIVFYDTSIQTTAGAPAAITFAAYNQANTANLNAANANTYIKNNYLANTTSIVTAGTINASKGFIYSPSTLPNAQTAMTVDFSANTVIRANISAPMIVSFANYTQGKVVELWITNSAAVSTSFTHGCSALNSTINNTAYVIPATSTVHVKYMSFGLDLPNNFVSIIHA